MTNKISSTNRIAETFDVFAYGSNLHLRRIQARVPSARAVSIGYVAGRQVLFHKRSADGSAKADAFRIDNSDHRVWGVVYRMKSAEKQILDDYEQGYDREQVHVVSRSTAPIVAWIYSARRDAIDASLRPYSWYMNFVLSGALQHRLPLCHISRLGGVPSRRDPDLRRHQENSVLMVGGTKLKQYAGQLDPRSPRS